MSETVSQPEKLSGLHILLVDDDLVFLKMVSALLSKLDVGQVTLAVNGSDAYAKLQKAEKIVDCIVCDYSMQAGNGLQLLQAVRTGQIKVLRPDTAFVLVTASRDPAVVEVAGKLEVNGYLVKPVKAKDLAAAILKARGRPVKIDFDRYSGVQVPLD